MEKQLYKPEPAGQANQESIESLIDWIRRSPLISSRRELFDKVFPSLSGPYLQSTVEMLYNTWLSKKMYPKLWVKMESLKNKSQREALADKLQVNFQKAYQSNLTKENFSLFLKERYAERQEEIQTKVVQEAQYEELFNSVGSTQLKSLLSGIHLHQIEKQLTTSQLPPEHPKKLSLNKIDYSKKSLSDIWKKDQNHFEEVIKKIQEINRPGHNNGKPFVTKQMAWIADKKYTAGLIRYSIAKSWIPDPDREDFSAIDIQMVLKNTFKFKNNSLVSRYFQPNDLANLPDKFQAPFKIKLSNL